MEAHQTPLSLGFSRQEHWSGLPFPSKMHESEKWKWSRSVVSNPQRPHGLQPTRLLHLWDFPGKSTGVGCHRLLTFNRKVKKIRLKSPCCSLNVTLPLEIRFVREGRLCLQFFFFFFYFTRKQVLTMLTNSRKGHTSLYVCILVLGNL